MRSGCEVAPTFVKLVPALVVRHVERRLQAGRDSSAPADDGFALGCAYLLHVFGAGAAWDDRGWFRDAIATSRGRGVPVTANSDRPRRPGFRVWD